MRGRRDLFLAALAVAVVLAIVALLASGAFRRVGAEDGESGARPIASGSHPQSPRRLVAGPGRSDTPKRYPPPGTSRIDGIVAPAGAVGTVLIGGFATWYDTPGFTAAAGPVLRDVLGDWRGRYVTVEAGDRSVVVQLTDFCACGERGGIPTLLDLSRSAFAALADPSLGVVRVSIEIDGSPRPDEADDRMRQEDGGPAATVPPTSTEDVR